MAEDLDDITCPSRTAPEADRLRWVNRMREMGFAFLESQSGWADIDAAISVIMGDPEGPVPDGMSEAGYNLIKSQVQEIVATYANMRYVEGFETDNSKYDEHTDILNRLGMNWYAEQHVDRKFKKVFQHAATSTGYACPVYDWKRQEIDVQVRGAKQVWPVGMPESNDLQEAYAVGIESDEPLWRIRETYGKKGEAVKADASPESYSVKQRVSRLLTRVRAPFWRNLKRKQLGLDKPKGPTAKLMHVYVRDSSVNRTGRVIPMGQKGTNWYYEVPFVGMPIPTGEKRVSGKNQETGEDTYVDVTRPATEEDARIYPTLRLITATADALLYDGPSPWWHGEVPAVDFAFDRWPWEFLGLSLVRDNLPLQRSNNRLLRAMDDSYNVRLDPPLAYDENSVAKTDIEKLNLRAPGQKLAANLAYNDKPIQPLVDLRIYDVPAQVVGHVQANEERMDRGAQVKNVNAMFRAAQVPSDDTQEKALEAVGPVASDRSNDMEASVARVFRQVGCLMLQFYDRPRRVRALGRAGELAEDYETADPNSMIPSEVPGQPAANKVQRARWFQRQIRFRLLRGTLHELTQTTEKLGLLQLRRAGVPISLGTLARAWKVENFIDYPDGLELKTEFEKSMWEARQLAEATQAAQGQQQQVPPELEALAVALRQLQGGAQAGPGRPPSGQTPPHMVQKRDEGGAPRTTISESK